MRPEAARPSGGPEPLLDQSSSPENVSISEYPTGGRSAPSRAAPQTPASHPSPPISQVSEAFPESGGLESAPSVKTASERPRGPKGQAARNAADPQTSSCNEFSHRQSIRIPLHRPQQRRKRAAGLPSGSTGRTPIANQVLLLSKRVHPARQAHQPLGPRETGHPPERAGQVRRGRSQPS